MKNRSLILLLLWFFWFASPNGSSQMSNSFITKDACQKARAILEKYKIATKTGECFSDRDERNETH